MIKKISKSSSKVLDFNKIKAQKKPSVTRLLKDSRKAADAIATRTCIICGATKGCVNKTGVCAYCFDNVLTSEERQTAKQEAQHKIIKINVEDDRWETE